MISNKSSRADEAEVLLSNSQQSRVRPRQGTKCTADHKGHKTTSSLSNDQKNDVARTQIMESDRFRTGLVFSGSTSSGLEEI